MCNPVKITNAKPEHYSQILNLNHKLVHFLSPLDLNGLKVLAASSAVFKVALKNDGIVAFVVALREGKSYDSINYQWFSQKYDAFLYIDRIVVSPDVHGIGIGKHIYRDIFETARTLGVDKITAEINSKPANDISLSFHQSMGFKEVGRQLIAGGEKEVSMQLKLINQI